MPLNNYAVLKGRPINNRLATGSSPHYQVLVSENGTLYRIAVNVRSQDGSEVEFLVRDRFEHPITAQLAELPEGLHPTPSQPGGVALDFIRGNLMQPWELKPLPISAAGPDNDLNEKIDSYIQRAMSDEQAMIYAFGETWGPENNKADQYFGFKPGRGIHDIHFNQGNPGGKYASQNGPWQDGGLILARIDLEQQVPGLHERALRERDLRDVARHPRPHLPAAHGLVLGDAVEASSGFDFPDRTRTVGRDRRPS